LGWDIPPGNGRICRRNFGTVGQEKRGHQIGCTREKLDVKAKDRLM
jgi:hypothetical protein